MLNYIILVAVYNLLNCRDAYSQGMFTALDFWRSWKEGKLLRDNSSVYLRSLQESLVSLGWFSTNLTSMTIVKCEWPKSMHPVQILTAAIDAQGVKCSDFL